MVPVDPPPKFVDFLLWTRNASADLCEIRADPDATSAEVADDVYSLSALLYTLRSQARISMPQTVFRNGFWSRLIELSRSDEAVAVFDRLATRDAVSQRLVIAEFFEAVIEACRSIQEERLPQGDPPPQTPGSGGGLFDQVWDLVTRPFQPSVERMPVTVREERIAWIVYNRRVRRVVATRVELDG
jgi:hypothetical protein